MTSHSYSRKNATFAPETHGDTRLHLHAIPFNLLGLLAIALMVIGLSNCTGSTSAAKTQPGVAPGAGVLTASSASVSFGSIAVGSSAAQSVSVTNTGTATVNLSQAAVSGAGFSVTSGSTSTYIPVGQSATVQIQFLPQSAGALTGSLAMISDASDSPLAISLSGTGTEGGLTATPPSVNFGGVQMGSSGSTSITLKNTGTAGITISATSVTGSGFSISGLSTPLTINAGQSALFTAGFAPASTASASGSISISSNTPGSPLAIPLSGTGMQPQVAVTPSSASFGSVVVGTSNSQAMTLKNTGTASLTISQVTVTGVGFSQTGLSAQTVAAGRSVAFNTALAPSAAGSASGSISITSNAPGSPLAIALSGTGVAATSAMTANPSSLSFGSVNVGSNSSLSVTIQNTGNSNITISGVTTSGAGFSANGVAAGTTLTPSQSTTLNAVFDPAAAGSVSGTVTVNSNASSPATVSLSGTGAQSISHSVALSWTASASSGVTGYNVYRGTITSGPYTKVNSLLDSATLYTDATVLSSQTYYYFVTAVDSSNAESTYSNPATALIP